MATETISRFYSDDHTRLDGLFERFTRLKARDLPEAIETLKQFKAGLEQHMAWEEAILFSEYDSRIPSADEESPTIDLRYEHEQLREYLENVLRKLMDKNIDTEKDDARLAELLAAHNWAEETGLYPKLDELLTDSDRKEIQQRMKDSALI